MRPSALDSAPPRAATAAVRSKAALQAALGAAGLAGVALGVVWLVTEPAEAPRSEVRIAAIEDWPEIKDGVPGMARTPAAAPAVRPDPLRAVELAPPSPPAAGVDAPGASSAAEPLPAAEQGAASPESAAAADTPAPSRIEPIDDTAADAGLPILAPLPPPAPRRTALDKPRPRKEQTARLPERAGTPPNQSPKPDAPAEAGAQASPAPSDDRIKVFGVPLPTGRDVKETFESLGDAVFGRPKRS